MITGFFGVPGVGKTTKLTSIAQKELRRIKKGKSPYKHILTNFYCEGCEKINFSELGVYKMEYCLVLLDELTLDADARDFKNFAARKKVFFTLHRHLNCDIVYFVQDYSRVDKTIRNLTYDLWYCTKTVLPFFSRWTLSRRIFRTVTINEYQGELILGYRYPNLLERIFTSTFNMCYRPVWYKYFDSFEAHQFDDFPTFEYSLWQASDDVDPDVDLTGKKGLLTYINSFSEKNSIDKLT